MGQLLTDVLILDNEGLVGFTEDGEQILLKGPRVNLSVGIASPSNVDEKIQEILKSSDNKTYVKSEADNQFPPSLNYKFYDIRG